jgi:hypothetical protein
MKTIFYTKHLDKTLYNQIIYKFISNNIDSSSHKLRDWEINIYPVESFNSIHPQGAKYLESIGGKMSSTMPHGVTGKDVVDIFVKDSDDYGLIVLQNTSVITHELSHMVLMIRFNDNPQFYKRGILRHADKSGNLDGTELNKWTQEVHDRETEGNIINMTVYRKVRFKWKPYTVRVLNLDGFPY